MMFGDDDFNEMYEERAAIMEFDAGMTRERAEKAAFKDICNFMDVT
jgi:hypothetical protein